MTLAALRDKSPEAFRTISEVAAELDMPQHVLRFWESRFTQVRPIKRAGGRRYYRPEDVDLLRGIRTLLYREGYTIKGAQKVMREKGPRHVAELGRAAFAASVAPSNIVSFEEAQRRDEMPDDEPRHARAALAMLERAHAETPFVAARDERGKLEALLAELLELKSRLRAARAASR
ncbi:MAG: MerR family transcriptional regulator [Alphaproteobacteria bacterium]|nr:MerR family transcriptional regulator [Alphaproteobacteria bacterium]MBV9693439.1 MerR family transcriptional regulator [Alphaproteobacteria bacterium]